MTTKEFFKKYWIPVALVIIGGAIWAYIYFSKPENKIKFGFDAAGLGSLLPSLTSRYANPNAKGFGFYLDVPMSVLIKNTSNKDALMKNIAGVLKFEGETIFQTKQDSKVLESVAVNARGKAPIDDVFQVLINGKTIKFVQDYLAGKKPKINYNLRADVFGETYTFKDTTVFGGGTFEEPETQT